MDSKKKKPSSSSSSSSSSESDSNLINSDQISLNKLLFEAQNLYRSQERLLAFEKYKIALELAEKMKNPEKIAFLKTNLGLISFENGEYKSCLMLLEESLSLLTLNKGELLTELKLKNMSSLCVVCVVLNLFEKAKDYGNKLTNLLIGLKAGEKRNALELVVFSLFKFLSFGAMQNVDCENIEELYQGVPLACFYSTLGLNRELNNEPSLALSYYLKALDVWKNCNEIGFVLISLKHLITLAPKAGLNVQDTANFMKLYQKLQQADDFKGLNLENLFKDYEQRLETAKEITLNLRKIEETTFSEEKSMNFSYMEENLEGFEPLWKQALRLRLLKALKMARNATTSAQIHLLAMGSEQILSTLTLLQDENNPIILNKLQMMSYTKESVNSLRAAINKIRKYILHEIYGVFFKVLIKNSQRKALVQFKKSQISAFVSKAYKEAYIGDYLIKCNNSSNGRIRKFYRLLNSGKLIVATKESFIENPSKSREIDLCEVSGLIFGKNTATFLKIYNKPLESFLCFSLVYNLKTIDFYCTEEQIRIWTVALSQEIKKRNPKAFVLKPGRILWRVFRLKMLEEMRKWLEKIGRKGLKCESLAKAVVFLVKAKKLKI